MGLTGGGALPGTPRPALEAGAGPAETRLPALTAFSTKELVPSPQASPPGPGAAPGGLAPTSGLVGRATLACLWGLLSPGSLVGAEQRGEGAVGYSLSPVPSGQGSSPRPRAPLFHTQGMVLAGDDSCKADSVLPPLHKERLPATPCCGPTALQGCLHLPVGTGEDIQVHAGCISCVWNGAMTPSQVFWGQTPFLWVPK